MAKIGLKELLAAGKDMTDKCGFDPAIAGKTEKELKERIIANVFILILCQVFKSLAYFNIVQINGAKLYLHGSVLSLQQRAQGMCFGHAKPSTHKPGWVSGHDTFTTMHI